MPEKKKRRGRDELDDEFIRDKVTRIFSKYPVDLNPLQI